MLTLTLKRLEADGILQRTAFPTVPVRVDYELTELGHTLRGALVPLQQWAARHKEAIDANRARTSLSSKHKEPVATDELIHL